MYKVSANIEYVTGSLAGLVIRDGFECTYPTVESAERAKANLLCALMNGEQRRAAYSRDLFVVRQVHQIEQAA